MKRLAFGAGFALSCALLVRGLGGAMAPESAQGSPPGPKAAPRLGINLAAPSDWSTELPFTDLFRSARAWISQKEGAPFGGGPALSLDAHGWVTRLEPGAWAETVLSSGLGAHLPGGDYTILYQGQGELELWGGETKVKARGPGRLVVTLRAPGENVFLRLRATSPADPVRRIRVFLPGFGPDSPSGPWHPALLSRWKGMAVVRFMDFQQTNGSQLRHLGERPTPDDATFAQKGVPVEWLVDLANRLGADPWFCMPHEADDAYVLGFAELVKARLDPGRRAFVEYSNEVWNAQFPQHAYAVRMGRKLGLAGDDHTAGLRYTARRSRQIFAIWERVFGGAARLQRVLPAQAATAEAAREIVRFEGAYKQADVLAVAPYFGLMPSPAGVPGEHPRAADLHGLSAEQLLDRVERTELPVAIARIQEARRVAAEHGLKLVAYEAGQHLVGVLGAENDEALTALFAAANRHPRMGALYGRYLDAWARAGGDVLCHFSSVARTGKWGSWGLLEYFDDDPRRSPKLVALLSWARGLGQAVPELR